MSGVKFVPSTGTKAGYIKACCPADAQRLSAQISTAFSRPLAEVEPGVIVGVEECLQDWCYVDVLNYDGWMPKSAMWGVYDHEVFED